MKRFIVSMPLLFASFLDTSSIYKEVSSDMEQSTYVNPTAIEVVRYDPPYYVIKGNMITRL